MGSEAGANGDKMPMGPIVGAEATKFGGWRRWNAGYAKQFGVEPLGWAPNAPKR